MVDKELFFTYIVYMIKWNEEKAAKILEERGIDFCDVAEEIAENRFAVRPVGNQAGHPGQRMAIVVIRDHAVCVPFVEESNGDIFIKTAFFSRKWDKRRPLW